MIARYAEEMTLTVTIGGKSRTTASAVKHQFAPELLHFSACVLEGREPRPSGREGLADLRVIEACSSPYTPAGPGTPGAL